MEIDVKYFLFILALNLVQIPHTKSSLHDRRRMKNSDDDHIDESMDNICEVKNRTAKLQCYCANTKKNTAIRADCWIFNGELKEDDPIWASFAGQPYLEWLQFNTRVTGSLEFVPLQLIRRLKSLRKLNIHYAKLNKIEKYTFSNISSLRDITITDSEITELDFSSFANLPELTNLTLKENEITEIQRDIFVNLPSLRYLDLSFNNINLIHDGSFEHLTELNDLILEANSITILTKDTFRGLANLTRLDLRSNKLSMVGDLTFTELRNLNELLLDDNELKYLSEKAFAGLTLLQKLTMTGNKLKSINEKLLEGVSGLELLDLRNNEIEFFTYENVKPIIDNLKMKTSVFYLSGNKLSCDCRLSWMHVLLNETKSEILQEALNDVTCFPVTPENETSGYVTESEIKDSKSEFEVITAAEDLETNKEESYEKTKESLKTISTSQPLITGQVRVIGIPIETLLCPSEFKQSKEDSLVLSSKDKNYWHTNSSTKKLSNLLIVLSSIAICIQQ